MALDIGQTLKIVSPRVDCGGSYLLTQNYRIEEVFGSLVFDWGAPKSHVHMWSLKLWFHLSNLEFWPNQNSKFSFLTDFSMLQSIRKYRVDTSQGAFVEWWAYENKVRHGVGARDSISKSTFHACSRRKPDIVDAVLLGWRLYPGLEM